MIVLCNPLKIHRWLICTSGVGSFKRKPFTFGELPFLTHLGSPLVNPSMLATEFGSGNTHLRKLGCRFDHHCSKSSTTPVNNSSVDFSVLDPFKAQSGKDGSGKHFRGLARTSPNLLFTTEMVQTQKLKSETELRESKAKVNQPLGT